MIMPTHDTRTTGARLLAQQRRGTMLIVALGVLAIIAIAAASYVTIARVERRSAAAVAREVNYQQQVNAMVAEIQAVVGADLWGNKLVTRSTPRIDDSGANVWPRAFEDGEFADHIYTHFNSLRNQDRIGLDPGDPFRYLTVIADDAWLAPAEPNFTSPRPSWEQYTNMRSMYRFNEDTREWVRDDGLYADLQEWFEQDINNRGNAAADILTIDPGAGLQDALFSSQMAELENPTNQLTGRDEALVVDTNGDLRPDARWQIIDRLGNLYGLLWVAATRITDASALVNVNASIEFGDVSRPGDGRTPGDVDLYRLLEDAAIGPAHNDVRVDRLSQTFRNHLEDSLRLSEFIMDLNDGSTNPSASVAPYTNWSPGLRLLPEQREAWWVFAGSSPLEPISGVAGRYPLRDIIDLQAYWSTNHSGVLSKVEETFDGPIGGGGYLPPTVDGTGPLGPLRAAEPPSEVRRYSRTDPRPSIEEIRDDTRRHLTTVSGAGQFSPVPSINYRDEVINGLYANRKVRLPNYGVNDFDEAYNALVWALAPMATDMNLGGELTSNNFGPTGHEHHYGGGDRSPAAALLNDTGVNPNAAFAIQSALSLTLNIKDASDTEDGGTNLVNRPTVMRAFVNYDPLQADNTPLNDSPATPEIEFYTRLSHGDIDPMLLPIEHMGQTITEAQVSQLDTLSLGGSAAALDAAFDYAQTINAGLTMVGLERQPFLREVSTFFFLSDDESDTGEPEDYEIDLTDAGANEHLGSAIAIELGNPWGEAITTTGYTVVIPKSPTELGNEDERYVFILPNDSIGPGESRVYYYAYDDGGTTPWSSDFTTDLRDQVVAATDPAAGFSDVLDVRFPQNDPTAKALFMPYTLLGGDGAALDNHPVLLMYTASRQRADMSLEYTYYMVDRMTPSPDADDQLGAPTMSGPVNGAGSIDIAQYDNWTNLGAGTRLFGNYGYFQGLGYDPNDDRVTFGNITGRVMITQSMTRPTGHATQGGFPAWVLENEPGADGDNSVVTSIDVLPWLDPTPPFPLPPTYPPDPVTPFAAASLIANIDDTRVDLGDDAKTSTISLATLPAFQLFVPNRDLLAPTELHMVSAYAHTCRNHLLEDLTEWETVGEKLAKARYYDFVSQAGTVNPYAGTLDPSRYLLNGQDGMAQAPNGSPANLTIPLAARVFDCFEALPVNGLAQGRININTMTDRVAALLPFVEPEFPVQGVGGVNRGVLQPSATGGGPDRVTLMRDWRNEPRSRDLGATMRGVRSDGRPGFAASGELAILGQWLNDGAVSTNRADRGFMELADGLASDGYPLEFLLDYANVNYNPTDDAEERLAIYRAVSNIVSTRSDVYIATFILRGYDPDIIETIRVTGSAGEAMNDELFRPEYESRWLCVLDRSEMVTPIDRPRVLLLVELPPVN